MRKIVGLVILCLGFSLSFGQILAEGQQKSSLNNTEKNLEEDNEEEEEGMSSLSGGVQTDQVLLKGLNKITAHTQEAVASVGQKVRFGDLEITARLCQKSPPEDSPEATAYLEVQEMKAGEPSSFIFSGWMFASTPAVSALEHPVYDIWVIDCQGQHVHELPSLPPGATSSSSFEDFKAPDFTPRPTIFPPIKAENQKPVDIFKQALNQNK